MRKFTFGFLLIFLCFNLMAQDRAITGIVTDPSGKPLRDVSVVVKGTNTGTVTGADGSFLLTVPATARTVVFSAINLRPQEVAIGTGNVVNASLALADQSLQEVVVTALGVRREKRSLGYSVSEVNAEDLTRVPNQNVINSLNGKVAGLQVIASGGAPGMASRVVIRGGNKSFRPTGSDPLVVVDGIPISNVNDGNSNTVAGVATPNRAGDINPDDIESISVLKGGAASVLYGSRGANGVMLITTKSGKNRGGKPAITFSTTAGMDEALRLPHFQKTFAQGQLIGGVPTYAEGTSTSFGPRITGQTVNSTGAGGPITLRVFDPRADFLRQGLTLNNNLSFSQSTDRGTYFLSVGHSAQTSIVPNQEYNKANLRFNVSNNLTSKLTAGANINYIKSWGDVPYTGQDGNNPIFGLFNMPVTWDINGYGFEYPDGSQKNFRGGAFDNPLWSVNRSFYNTSADRFIGNVNFGYQLSPWINLTYKFGGDLSTDYRKAFRDLKTGGSPNGFLSNDDVFRQELNSTFLANFQRRLNKDIGFTLTVGHDFNQRTLRQIIQSVSSLTLPRVAHMSNGKDINPNVENLANQRLMGVLGDLQVDFKNYFFLGLRGRNEWSSTLPADNRSYFYPGVNGSFVFTDAFKLSGNVLSYGKLRGGYAKTARDAPPYNTIDVFTPAIFGDGFTSGITFPFGSVPGYTVSNTIRNPFLQPEFTKEFEVGGELRFLKSRLNLDVTYFRNVNDNNIVVVNISPATGATGSVLNTARSRTKGLN
jgi:TonB-linked SusC/RagA family outer membrane protein